MKDSWDELQVGFRTGGMKDRWNTKRKRCRTGRRDAVTGEINTNLVEYDRGR